MSVTLSELLAAVRARRASIVAEVAGYLVLGVADQIAGAPRVLAASEVALSAEGLLRIAGGAAASDTQAEASLRALLGRLLGVAASVTPALMRAANRPAAAGVAPLIHELEVALIPVNRSAARRALARLHRDVTRAKEAGLAVMLDDPPEVRMASRPIAPQAEDPEPDEPSVEVQAVEADPGPLEAVTPAEPVLARRRTNRSPEVPDLELPPEPTPLPEPTRELTQRLAMLDESDRVSLELVDVDATDRAPELTPELDLEIVVELTEPLPSVEPAPPPPASVLEAATLAPDTALE
jgi:hypothetical protein